MAGGERQGHPMFSSGCDGKVRSVGSLPRLRGRGGEGDIASTVRVAAPTLALPRKRERERSCVHLIHWTARITDKIGIGFG